MGPMLLLAFVALGCVLCFLVSVPAFILAWIPPVRRLFSWLLRWRFLVLGCLVTLVALFYAVEDWRGGARGRTTSARGRPKASGLTGQLRPAPGAERPELLRNAAVERPALRPDQRRAWSGATRIGGVTSSSACMAPMAKMRPAPATGSRHNAWTWLRGRRFTAAATTCSRLKLG